VNISDDQVLTVYNRLPHPQAKLIARSLRPFERSGKKEEVGIGDSSFGKSGGKLWAGTGIIDGRGRTTLVRLEEDEFGSYRCR
jgi:hypothetical protein